MSHYMMSVILLVVAAMVIALEAIGFVGYAVVFMVMALSMYAKLKDNT